LITTYIFLSGDCKIITGPMRRKGQINSEKQKKTKEKTKVLQWNILWNLLAGVTPGK